MIFTRSLLLPLMKTLSISSIAASSLSVCCCKQTKFSVHIINPCRTLVSRRRPNYTLDENEADSAIKSQLISKLNFKSDEDALPFRNLPVRTLLHIHNVTKNDEKKGFCKNRLYYISERIKCNPSVLSARLAQRTFIYTLSFDWLESSLDVLLEMGVPTERILRDLWVLKYHHGTIRERLQRIKNEGIDTMYPWMVRCSEEILQRYISITKEAKDILGDTKSTLVYIANRLNVTPEAVQDMCYRIPALKTIRVAKAKSFIDFLENEGYQTQDIANKPRILTASQKTVKERLEKLRKLGLAEINLNVLCRSRKDFKKYCESIESVVSHSSGDNT